MDIDVLIEDSRWNDVGLVSLAEKALGVTLDHLGLDRTGVEISLLACNDTRIASLNGDFRNKSDATNVLSWPAEELAAKTPGQTPLLPESGPDGCLALGDIAISYDTCLREAKEMARPIAAHVTHLLVHGTLHLLGYDHIRDPDASLMQGIEIEILGKMGLNDPYRI